MPHLQMTPEQRDLTASLSRFLDRATSDDGPFDQQSWTTLAEMGVFGWGCPDEPGDPVDGLVDLAWMLITIGKSQATGPFLGTILAARIAARAGKTDLLAQIASGRISAAFGRPVDHGHWLLADDLPGDVDLPELIVGVSPEGVQLLEMPSDRAAIRDPDGGFRVDSHEALPIAREDAPGSTRPWWEASVLVSAYQVGVAQAALDDSVQYVSVREQFGRPIGAFQAVKHRCAEMAVRAELAKSQAIAAAGQLEAGSDDTGTQVAAAHVVAGEAAHRNAADNLKNHGAMGFAMESSCHRYVRRAWQWNRALGGSSWFVDRLGVEPPQELV